MPPAYPVRLDIVGPDRYSRAQLALRVVLFVLIGMVGCSLGALFLVLYLALPAFAAIALSNGSSERFQEVEAPRIVRFLRWIIAIYAYFALVTDQFPTSEPDGNIHLAIQPGGHPTISSALLRVFYGLPSVLVLAILLWLAAIAWLFAFLLVLIRGRYGRGLYEFQTGILRWMARLLAYQASIVQPYPPFSLGEAALPPPVHASGPL